MSEVGKASIKLEVDSSQLSEALAKGVEQAIKTITSTLNLDEVVGQKSKAAGETLEKNISDGAKGADDSLKKVGEDGFDGVDQGSRAAGEKVADNIGAGARAADEALDQVGAGAFDGVAQQAVSAQGSITDAFTTAANASAESLTTVGTGAFSGVTNAAANAEGAVSGAFADAAQSANASLITVGSGAFSGVPTAAESAASQTAGIFSRMASRASEAGASIKTNIGNAFEEANNGASLIPSSIKGIAGAALAVAGPMAVLKGGFDRLMDIQKSEIVFKNIGLSAEQTKDQMARLSDQVTGTSVSLSDAASVSAAFAQSGIEIGDSMDNAIQAFTNLDAIGGQSGVNISAVMQQISAQGKITGGDLMQLSNAGINAAQYIADAFGVTTEEARKMVSEGKVSFDDFVGAVNEGTGSLAKEMGETLPAKMANLKTALANLGANIIEPFIPGITAAVEFGINIVKWAITPIKALREWMSEGSAGAEIFKAALAGIGTALGVGAIIGAVNALKEMTLVIKLVSGAWKMLNLAFLFSPIGLIVAGIAALVAGFVLLWNKVEGFRNFWKAVWDGIVTAVKWAWDGIIGFFTSDTMTNLWNGIVSGAKVAWDVIVAIWDGAVSYFGAVFSGMWAAIKVGWDAISAVFTWAWENVLSPIYNWISETWGKIGEKLAPVWDWISTKLSEFGTWLSGFWTGTLQPIFQMIGDKLAEIWAPIQQWMVEHWPVLKTILMILGGVILAPIIIGLGAVVIAITAVIAIVGLVVGAITGFIYVLVSLPGWISNVVTAIGDWFGRAWQWTKDRFNDMGAAVSGWWRDHVAPLPGRVGDAIRGVIDWFKNLPGMIRDKLSDAGSWLVDTGKNIIRGLMDGLGSMAGKIGEFFLDKLPGWIKKPFMKALGIHSPSRVFAAYGENIGEGLIRGMDGMQADVSAKSDALAVAARTNVPEIAAPGVPAPSVPAAASAIPAAPAAASAATAAAPAPVQAQPISATAAPEMMGAAQDAFTGMAAAMSAAETGVLAPMWAQETANAGMFGGTVAGATTGTALPAWQMMASGMSLAAAGIMSPMFAAQTLATQAFGGTVSNTALGVIAPAWAAMAGQFPAQVNGQINPALGAMGAGLWNVLNTGVNPVFGAIQGGLQTVVGAFGTGVNAITAQWDRVREATASPVRFAIQSVFNDGLVGMWNSVSDLLGTQKMGAYPVRFATGGYVRGPGGPTADKVPALLSNGEYVVKAKAVDKIGVQNLNALNSGAVGVAPGVMKDSKAREAALNDRTFKAMASRYAGGGVVQGSKAWEQLRKGMMWAKSRHGRPYVLGGDAAGSGGTDCSGFMSGIADVIQGGAGHRRWATMAFNGGGNSQHPSGPQGFAAGLRNGFAIGVTNGGAAGGHTAGTIGGVEGLPAVNVESGGSPSMVKFAVGAAGANDGYFRTHYHLPFTADGGFVSGGGGVDFGELIRSSMEPHKKRMMAAAQGFKASHPGLMGGVPLAVAEKLSKAIEAKADKLAEAMGGDPGGGGVARWAPLVRRALAHVGFPVTEANVRAMLAQIQSESGGNPNINQQITDINGTGASAGQGLLQIIPGTFADFRDPSLPNDRRHPFANMVAALRYYKSRYGMDLNKMWGHGHGYDLGGVMSNPGMFGKFTSEPERVLSPQQTASFDRLVNWLDSTTAPTVRSHRPGTAPDYGDGRNVRTVAVTQNIMGGNAQDTANAVEDRLMKLMV